MTAALFSFIGIIIGATLQYFFSRHLDSVRANRDARTSAYTDYLRCVSELANLTGMSSSDAHVLRARTADAKSRSCLYGSAEAVSAFARFERLGAILESPEQRAAFTRMVSIMRSDSTRSAAVTADDLQAVLLGVDRHAK